MQEGSSADIAPHIGEIEQETALAPKRAEAEDTSGPSASALLPSAAATNDPAANRGADGDFAVYQWYFRAIGWGNLAAFLFLSMLFVVGVIYPRTRPPPPPPPPSRTRTGLTNRVQRSG